MSAVQKKILNLGEESDMMDAGMRNRAGQTVDTGSAGKAARRVACNRLRARQTASLRIDGQRRKDI